MQASPTVSPFQQTQQSNGAAAAAAAAGAKTKDNGGAASAVDFQNFLTLLTAQLQNQDPLYPADSTEFVAQLAQFTSVEQLVNANNNLDSIASAMVADGIDKYADWIGKQAEATGAPAYFDGVNPVKYRFSGDTAAVRVQTVITDSKGAEITRFNALNGTSIQSWSGKVDGANVATGPYAVTALYYNKDGEVYAEEIANTFGGVREVRFDGKEPSIVLEGGIDIDPAQIAGLGLKD